MIWLKEFFGQLMDRVKINEVSTFNGEFWEPKSWPKDAEGVGLTEAPRGALAHWIKIHERRHRELSAGCADHLERLAARCQGAALIL
jgi:Ni,Fe-hydrogenase I large subunit